MNLVEELNVLGSSGLADIAARFAANLWSPRIPGYVSVMAGIARFGFPTGLAPQRDPSGYDGSRKWDGAV